MRAKRPDAAPPEQLPAAAARPREQHTAEERQAPALGLQRAAEEPQRALQEETAVRPAPEVEAEAAAVVPPTSAAAAAALVAPEPVRSQAARLQAAFERMSGEASSSEQQGQSRQPVSRRRRGRSRGMARATPQVCTRSMPRIWTAPGQGLGLVGFIPVYRKP
jgi:hypothetical protein